MITGIHNPSPTKNWGINAKLKNKPWINNIFHRLNGRTWMGGHHPIHKLYSPRNYVDKIKQNEQMESVEYYKMKHKNCCLDWMVGENNEWIPFKFIFHWYELNSNKNLHSKLLSFTKFSKYTVPGILVSSRTLFYSFHKQEWRVDYNWGSCRIAPYHFPTD